MSQRNPLNERYQNTDERSGKTRKSAASAKPVSKAAASVRVEGRSTEEPKGLLARATKQANKSAAVKNSKKKTASKATVERRREQAIRSQYYNPDTPEYKKWRRIWWVMLVGAILSTAISFYSSSQEALSFLTYPMVGLSYVLLLLAIILEFSVIRRIRNAYQEQMIAADKSKKNSVRRKEAAARARMEAKEAAQASEYQQEERKLFRGLFTKKRASDAVTTAKAAQARASQDEALSGQEGVKGKKDTSDSASEE